MLRSTNDRDVPYAVVALVAILACRDPDSRVNEDAGSGSEAEITTSDDSATSLGSDSSTEPHTETDTSSSTASSASTDTSSDASTGDSNGTDTGAATRATIVIDGDSEMGHGGSELAVGGDVNGDGIFDLVISAERTNEGAGRVYVIFGGDLPLSFRLDAVGNTIAGFVIHGAEPGDNAGRAVVTGHDYNEDGLADIVVGSPGGPSSRIERVHVIFGKEESAPVTLAAVGVEEGFVIEGEAGNQDAGQHIAALDDVNGDGRPDLAIGAPQPFSEPERPGRVYVVFMPVDGTAIQLADVAAGQGGFIIDGQGVGAELGPVAAAGDVNGDGRGDLAVGAPRTSLDAMDAGRAYIVYGDETTTPVNLDDLVSMERGVVIKGAPAEARLGWSIAGLGDVNGDGSPDVAVAAPYMLDGAGQTYVILGPSTPGELLLTALEQNLGGFTIAGTSTGDYAGWTLERGGDINKDGFSDIMVGASLVEKAYVVWGTATTQAVMLADVEQELGGLLFEDTTDQPIAVSFGAALAGEVDLDGDGFTQIAVSAPGTAIDMLDGVGRIYIYEMPY